MLIERLMKLALLGSEWVLYLLLALSVLSIAPMVERWIYSARRRGNPEKLRGQLVARLDLAAVAGAGRLLAEDRPVRARIARVALRWRAAGPAAPAGAGPAERAPRRA